MPKKVNEGNENSKSLILRAQELWPDRVDGGQLLDELTYTLARFVSARSGLLETVALWILYSYVFDAFDLSPILAITSPEKRCGKSTLLMLLEALVSKPLAVSHITPAALFRTIEKYSPTLLIDEADTFMTRNEELRGIINSGHTRQTAFVIRTVGENHDPQRFTTWAPKVIAMIGSLPDTNQDRSIIAKMQRKLKSDRKERLRRDRMGEFNDLCRRAARWAADHFDELRASDAEVPELLSSDRERDNWRVLLTIADTCGEDWAKRAREIACQFAGSEPVSESPRTLLLQDLKLIFEEKGEEVTSEEIIKSLSEMQNRSWAEWRNGKAISPQGLAKLLKPLDIEPQKWRDGKETYRGYHLCQFTDAFPRYLPSMDSPQPPHDLESTACNDLHSPQEPISVATTGECNSKKIKDVATVAIANGGVKDNHGRERQIHWKLQDKQVLGEAKTGACEGGCGNWIPFYFLNGTGYGYCQICLVDQSIESQFME